MKSWRIREATSRDLSDIKALLTRDGLPIEDIESARPDFIVACDRSILAGVGGFERFGAVGLLRSIAVHEGYRHTGLGRTIVRELEQRAREVGLTEFVLLTETAQTFFEGLGYGVIDREAAPPPVQESLEFRALCPQSACCMSRPLDRAGGQGRA